VRGHDLLVLLPRLAAGVAAVFLARDGWRLLRGRRTWALLGRGGGMPTLLSGWAARAWGVIAVLLATAFATFALRWRGPAGVP
jgi:hypothetical protein